MPWQVERLDPALLPTTYVAWRDGVGESSGVIHSDVRARFEAGHLDVVTAMNRFAKLATEGRDALVAGDVRGLMAAVDDNFDNRARIWPIAPDDANMVKLGRSLGAAVKQAGSGGAVVGVLPSDTLPSSTYR